MWRGVKTSTWSPQLLFAGHTHNNLRSIPTSTNHIQSNTITFLFICKELGQAGRGITAKLEFEVLWKPAQIFSPPQLVRKCLTAENIGGFQLVRGSVVSPVLWNCSKFLKLRDPVSMSIPGTGRVAVDANKVVFYVGLGGHYVNIFIGVLPGLIWITGKLLGLALLCFFVPGQEPSEARAEWAMPGKMPGAKNSETRGNRQLRG